MGHRRRDWQASLGLGTELVQRHLQNIILDKMNHRPALRNAGGRTMQIVTIERWVYLGPSLEFSAHSCYHLALGKTVMDQARVHFMGGKMTGIPVLYTTI